MKFDMLPGGGFDRGTWETDKMKYTFKKVPVLEIDGGKVQVAQSRAIERLLARTFDMYGGNDLEQADIDTYTEQITDIRTAYYVAREKDGQATALNHTFAAGEDNQSKYWSTFIPAEMTLLESVVAKANCKENFVGGKLSLADVQFYSLVANAANQEAVTKALSSCPILSAIFKKIAEDPKVVAWIAKRPQTPF